MTGRNSPTAQLRGCPNVKRLLTMTTVVGEKGDEKVANFRLELFADAKGEVEWTLDIAHKYGRGNDVDRKTAINVINKLSEFTAQLEEDLRPEV